MSYIYNPGDGLAVLDANKPDGATEPGSILDDAIKQIKAYLKDATAANSPAGLLSALNALSATVSGLASQIGVTGNKNTFVAYTSVNQLVVSPGSDSLVQFNNKVLDPDNVFDTGAFKFVAPANGLFFFTVALRIDLSSPAAPTGITHRLKLKVNGADAAISEFEKGDSTNGETFALTRCLQLNAGNEVTAYYQPSLGGGSTDFQITADSLKTVFQGFRI